MADLRTWLPPRWVAHVVGAANTVMLGIAAVLFLTSLDAPWTGWGFRGGTFPVQIALLVMSWVLAARRPQHPVGWVMSAAQLVLSIDTIAVYLDLFAVQRGWSMTGVVPGLLQSAWVPGILLLLLALALFPDGRLPRSRLGRAVVLLAGPALLGAGTAAFLAGQHLGAGVAAPGPDEPLEALFILYSVFTASVVLAVAQRFGRSSGIERQQLRWVIYAALLYAASLVPAAFVTASAAANALSVLNTVLMTVVVVAMGMAILRYRLYDLDRIVSRTLAYVLLTGVVVAVWVGVALLPTVVLGSGDVDNATVAVATLAAMAVAQPLRSRIQRVIDRRLYRSRYDAQQVAEGLGLALADEIDLPALERRVVASLARTVQPKRVALWVPDTPASTP